MSEEQQVGAKPRRRSQAEVEQLVAEFEASGLRRGEFCQEHGLATGTLDGYRKRLRQGRDEAAGGSRLVAVELCGRKLAAGSGRDSGLALALPKGWRIEIGRGFDTNTLQQVVRVLEQI
jgi:hypothetical protein